MLDEDIEKFGTYLIYSEEHPLLTDDLRDSITEITEDENKVRKTQKDKE